MTHPTDRFNRRLGYWKPRANTFDPTAAHAAADEGLERARAADAELHRKVVYPVIKSEHPRWFQVLRMFTLTDGVGFEVIGESPNEQNAIAIATKEQGRAIVTHFRRRERVFDNLHDIERR